MGATNPWESSTEILDSYVKEGGELRHQLSVIGRQLIAIRSRLPRHETGKIAQATDLLKATDECADGIFNLLYSDSGNPHRLPPEEIIYIY